MYVQPYNLLYEVCIPLFETQSMVVETNVASVLDAVHDVGGAFALTHHHCHWRQTHNYIKNKKVAVGTTKNNHWQRKFTIYYK